MRDPGLTPDGDFCPGCGQLLTDWRDWEHHYLPGVELSDSALEGREERGTPWPYYNARPAPDDPRFCRWSRDYLTCRWWARCLNLGYDLLGPAPAHRRG